MPPRVQALLFKIFTVEFGLATRGCEVTVSERVKRSPRTENYALRTAVQGSVSQSHMPFPLQFLTANSQQRGTCRAECSIDHLVHGFPEAIVSKSHALGEGAI